MEVATDTLWFAFGLTLLAGLSTGIGSLMALYVKTTNQRFLSATLGFSAGVMIYVSMIEIIAEARASLGAALGPVKGNYVTTIAFAGIAVVALIDKLVPRRKTPRHGMSGRWRTSGPGNGKGRSQLIALRFYFRW